MSPVAVEPIIDADLPIVDAHHHLWFLPAAALSALAAREDVASRSLLGTFRQRARYLFDEYIEDAKSGHNIRASVFVEARAMYRSRGPDALKSVGEVEFANGVAAVAESGLFGPTKVCAGIVGGVDLRLGDAVEEILQAHIQAGGGRYRGIRSPATAYDEDRSLFGPANGVPHLLSDARFREGFKWLERLGLSFDVLLLESQLPDLVDLARAFPHTQIVLNHVGVPVGVGRHAGKREQRFPIWREHIQALARCANVAVKLGGLGLPFGGFSSFGASPPATSEQLASQWRQYLQTCIEAFGVHRCMFQSNFPVDAATCSYATLWNAYKRVVAGASDDEKRALFAGTATRVYWLDI